MEQKKSTATKRKETVHFVNSLKDAFYGGSFDGACNVILSDPDRISNALDFMIKFLMEKLCGSVEAAKLMLADARMISNASSFNSTTERVALRMCWVACNTRRMTIDKILEAGCTSLDAIRKLAINKTGKRTFMENSVAELDLQFRSLPSPSLVNSLAGYLSEALKDKNDDITLAILLLAHVHCILPSHIKHKDLQEIEVITPGSEDYVKSLKIPPKRHATACTKMWTALGHYITNSIPQSGTLYGVFTELARMEEPNAFVWIVFACMMHGVRDTTDPRLLTVDFPEDVVAKAEDHSRFVSARILPDPPLEFNPYVRKFFSRNSCVKRNNRIDNLVIDFVKQPV